ncbi:hypothetical protein [Leucobacter tenebrionis]|uniref:hypothetical protein n=1 Tax=Leucobacter tenebrionis TaxID=2873270 RepID=UPI001CA698BA|nr:hypothetical protein [Leucobacter tenebrionis]QZY50606.1 hypothetical protein KVY00_08050 [Leucobacter tenebrionis]
MEDDFGWDRAVARPVGIPPGLEIAVIRTADDWADLCREFPLAVTAEKRQDWYRTTGRAGEWVMPDWEQVAGHYDGVHLTTHAYLTAAGRAIDLGDPSAPDPAHNPRASVIAGWNPDQTFWLTDRVRVWDEPAVWEQQEPDAGSGLFRWRQKES